MSTGDAESRRDSGGAVDRDRPALSRLLVIPTQEFADAVWGVDALLSRAADLPRDFSDLFDNEAVDELVGRRGLRAPFLRVAKNGVTLADSEFTRPGGVGASIGDQVSDDRLLDLFAGGSTLVLQALHRTWGPIIDFAGDLSSDLGHPVQANAYVTPAQSTGFSSHYDVHDVFVLQISGTKRWVIRAPVHPLPLRSQPWEQRRTEVAAASAREPLLDVILEPGDCLYLPRGFLHAANALGEISTHVTIGIHAWTRTHLADQMTRATLAALADSPALRQSLPLGAGFAGSMALAGDVEIVRAALIEALRGIDADALERSLAAAHRGSQRAAPVGPVATVTAAAQLAPGDDLALRAGLAAALDDGPEAVLITRAGRRSVAEGDLPVMRKLLSDKRISVDEAGMELSRRLLLAGLVVRESRPVD